MLPFIIFLNLFSFRWGRARVGFGCSVGCFGVFRGVAPQARCARRVRLRVRVPGSSGGRRLSSSGPGQPGVSGAISHPPLSAAVNAAPLATRDFRVSVACRDRREPRMETLGTQANLAFVCNDVLSNFFLS